jgi:hypothetical protein
MRRAAGVLLTCWLALPLAAQESDGPYVLSGAEGQWFALSSQVTDEGSRRVAEPVGLGSTLTIAAVGDVPAFAVKLRPPARVSADSLRLGTRQPLFVVADTHGEFEILAGMLRRQGIVDEKLRWSFGRGHLVLLGDVLDRGPHHIEILWLLYQLEAEASQAGGGVHLLLGTHEAMVLRGDLRYLHPRYRTTVAVLGVGSYAELLGPASVLGQWLRTRAAVLKINDRLLAHGGLSAAMVDRKLSIADINAAVRGELDEPDDGGEFGELVMRELGPLWFRGYFGDARSTAVPAQDVDRVLTHFGVRQILVGHTRVPAIAPLYDGKVIAVQVYPRRLDDGAVNFEALLIRGDKLFRATPDGGKQPLP